MAWKPSLPRCFWIVCAGLVLAGCQEQEQIRSYDVPKEPTVRARKPGGAARVAGRPFQFTKPDDWEERPSDNRMGVARAAVFLVRDGEQQAEASVVTAGGGMEGNVNRWRRQVGLARLDAAQIRKELRSLDVAGAKAPYVDLTGRDATGPQRILGAWIIHDGQTWFIKMKGPPELVGKQQAAFEAFVQSIRFAEGLRKDEG